MTDFHIEVPGLQTIACLLASVPALMIGMAYENVLVLITGAAVAALAGIGWSQYWRDVDLLLAEYEAEEKQRELEEQEDQHEVDGD